MTLLLALAVLATLAGTAGWYAALGAIPPLESEKLWRAMQRRRVRTNVLTAGRLSYAPNDIVPLTNADMVSRAVIYDLSEGPLLFEAEIPADLEYWSVSVFARTTDTIFVANDRMVGAGSFRLIVRHAGEPCPMSTDAEAISSSTRGLLLVRAVLRDRNDQADVARTITAIARDRATIIPDKGLNLHVGGFAE